MRLFIHVIEEGKCGGKEKDVERSDDAKEQSDPPEFSLSHFHGAVEAKRCSITVRVLCSVIRGAAPPFWTKVASISGR